MLTAAPKSTDVLSAHHCIAVFLGTTDDEAKGEVRKEGIGRFQIERYLKYAHLFPELACGLMKQFDLQIAAVDVQTVIFGECGDESLSAVVAQLEAGDKVELEWLQIRVEMDTAVDADRYGIVEQCQKLCKLHAEAEGALIKEFPEPQIMIRKPEKQREGKRKGKGAASKAKNRS